MIKIRIAVLIILAGAAVCPAQWVVDTRTDIPKTSEQEIGFLEETPVIAVSPQTFVAIKEGHVSEGQTLNSVAATAA